jgi:6-pyruvoyltetrahydropterin/6-carboxytetrahydropterin synthase
MKYTVPVKYDEKTDEYYIEFPDEAINELSWKIGDVLDWRDNSDGSYTITKKDTGMGKFYSTKTYGNERGLSTCFRQWRSTHSHCSLLHGYSIGVRVVFECSSLDDRNWVMDFGGLKEFKEWLEHMFDHTLVVAEDDPQLQSILLLDKGLHDDGIADVRIVPAVGCERFAELAFNELSSMIDKWRTEGTLLNRTVRVKSVEVFEHAGNSAIYEGSN